MPKSVRPIRPLREQKAPETPTPSIPDIKKVSGQSKRSVFLIMLGLPLFLVSSVVLYRRVIEGQDKRIQLGEYTPDGGLRMFSNEEKEERDNKSWLTWIFGKDK